MLGLVSALAAPVFMTVPAAAGGLLNQGDAQNDVIDFVRHPQNSFRPPVPWSAYQYDAATTAGPQDITSWGFDAGTIKPGYYTARIKTKTAIPRNGDPLTALPTGFSDTQYAWYFQTNLQNSKQQIGTDCVPLKNGGDGTFAQGPLTGTDPGVVPGVVPNSTTAIRFSQAGTNTCASAVDEGAGTAGAQVPVAAKRPIFEVPHPTRDGWWMVITLDVGQWPDALPGGGHFCKKDTTTGQYPPICLKVTPNWGIYEGYSGFQTTQSGDLEDGANVGPPFIVTYVSNNEVQVQAPYNPQNRGIDGDGLADDTTLFPTLFGAPGGKVTAVVAETAGTVSVTVDPICQAIDTAIGDQLCNGLIGGAGFGFLVIRDWAPDLGFHLRQLPRQPGYLPNPDPTGPGVRCRYPVGHFPAAPAPLTIPPAPQSIQTGDRGAANSGSNTAGALLVIRAPGSVGYDLTPLTRNWWIEPRFDQGPLTALNTQSNMVAGNGSLDDVNQPLAPVGQDAACNYTYYPPGLHYEDQIAADIAMS